MLFFRMNNPDSLEVVHEYRRQISVLHPSVPVMFVATNVGTDYIETGEQKDLSSELSTETSE